MKAKVERNIKQGLFIKYLMSHKEVGVSRLAGSVGVSPSAISHVIWGTARSKGLEEIIARELGFKSWKDLKIAEAGFNNSTKKTFKEVCQEAQHGNG